VDLLGASFAAFSFHQLLVLILLIASAVPLVIKQGEERV
jgi:hypothetical protein